MPDPVNPEPQTGPLEGRCGAVRHRNSKGEPDRWCRNWPMKGQTRCRLDGGKAPQNLAAAERRQTEAAAAVYVAKYGVPAHIEWHEAIQQGLDETYGAVLALRDLIQQLRPEALIWGITQVVEVGSSQFPGVDTTQAAGIAPIVALYGAERDRLHRMAVDAGKLGLQAQKQQFDRQVGLDLAGVIERVLGKFGVDVTELEVRQAVAAELNALSSRAVAA